MKFAAGATVLSDLSKKTSSANQDLGGLVRDLFAAAEPLEGKFNGQGRAMFDSFKSRVDEVATELNASLAAVLQGIQGQDAAFAEGDSLMADSTKSVVASTNFDAAKFAAR